MSINEKKPLFVRIAGERQPNLLPVTASAVGFDFNRDRFVFYHTASDDWADISPDGVDFVGAVYADNFFSAGVVTASLGFSGSLTQLADGTSYLIAGPGIVITSASNGAITIESPTTPDAYWNSTVANQIFTTASLVSFTGSLAHGNGSIASGPDSHAEGFETLAIGEYSHAEGDNTQATGIRSHAEGSGSIASNNFSHAEGSITLATGFAAHSEGSGTTASGSFSHAEGYNTLALGDYSHAEGALTRAISAYSHAEGNTTLAAADYAHTEGYLTTGSGFSSHAEGGEAEALGIYSHAEGFRTIASGSYSHAEGHESYASGTQSHAEGFHSLSVGISSHAEGFFTTSSANDSHSEGFRTITFGYASHAEGSETIAFGEKSHAEGQLTITLGPNSHAEGYQTTASANTSHAEGGFTNSSGSFSHAEGYYTITLEIGSHAEGYFTTASAPYSHAEGNTTFASGTYSHAEGGNTIAIGEQAHAEGGNTIALGFGSHAEGLFTTTEILAFGGHAEGAFTTVVSAAAHAEGAYTIAVSNASHAEGYFTTSSGEASHAEGLSTTTFGSASHAEGLNTVASGNYSHAAGIGTIASGSGQTAIGSYNLRGNDFSFFVIGDGTDDSNRSDILRVNPGLAASVGRVEVTGTLVATLALSGSLTQLPDGTSYLIAGTNISITSESNGAVTIASTGGGSGDQYWISAQNEALYTTGSALFRGPGGTNTSPADFGTDTFFYVSGSIGSKDSAVTGTAVFGGDVVISGTLHGGSPLKIGSGAIVTGALEVTNYLALNPYESSQVPIGTTDSAYLFASGALGKLYFGSYHDEDAEEQKISLDWIKAGSLHTGLLYGGRLTTAVGSTTFSITSGSGLIVRFRTSDTKDPYPFVKQVTWDNFISQSLTYVTSSQLSYIGIDISGSIVQQPFPFTPDDRNNVLTLGRISHPTLTTAQLANMFPDIAYGTQEWHDEFTRAFGPLKISGHTLTPSGSSLRVNKAAGSAYIAGGNYFYNSDRPNSVLDTEDTEKTNLIYVRLWVSGSDLQIEANPPTGFTALDPNNYNLDGTKTAVPSGSFSVQRLYWIPRNSRDVINTYYGSEVYNTLGDAVAGITTENFVESSNTKTSNIFLGYVAVQSGSTDLSDPLQAKIIQGGLSRNVAGGGGAAGTGVVVPGGLPGYVQYNLNGTDFAGEADFTYNPTTNLLTVGSASFGGDGELSTTATTFNLLDTTAQTINFGGAATVIDVGSTGGTTTLFGAVKAPQGLSGSLTQLTDGSSYLIAGANVTITSASNGAVTISSAGGGSGEQYWFSTGSGETYTTGSALVQGNLTVLGTIFGGSPVKMSGGAVVTGSLEVTGFITGALYASGGISGSLTQLTDGTSYLIAGSGVQITTGANGAVTVVNTGQYPPAGSQGQVQYYDGGNFGGSALFTFDPAVGAVTASTYVATSAVITTVTSSKAYTGHLEADNYLRLNPYSSAQVPIGTTTSSYMFSSGANGNMYFANYHTEDNTDQFTSLDWLRGGALHTGLLFGGKLTTEVGSTTFSITSGSGIIVDYNTSDVREPYPIITQVRWSNFISQSLTYVTSSQLSYIGIDRNANIVQQTSPFNPQDRANILQLGRISHPALTTAQLANMFPDVAYGGQEFHDDFTRAFGPLKVSGHKLTVSGSSLRVNKGSGESYIAGGNYFFDADRPNYILATEDTEKTNLIYVRLWVSGTDLKIEANPPTGFTALDPNNYNLDGVKTAVPSGSFSVQRLYWIPRNSRDVINGYYGSEVYSTLGEAVAGITTENFVESDNTKTSNIFLGYVAVQSGSTDLSDPTKAKIIQGGLSRNVAGGGGAAGVGAGATVAGAAGYVQYNLDGTNFGAEAAFSYNSTTNVLTVGNAMVGGTGELMGTGLTFDLLDSTVQTINFGGAATTIDVGSTGGTNTLFGATKMPQGLSGSLTQLTDGSSYLIGGTGIQITSASNGAVTIANAGITAVTAGVGLTGGGTSGAVTLDINDSVVATISGSTFTGAVRFNQGLSGSLTHLTDGSSYLIAGENAQVVSASNGAITVSTPSYAFRKAIYLLG